MRPRPASAWTPSPNFNARPAPAITCVVIHATESSGIEGTLEFLCSAKAKASYHYMIGKTGAIFHLVHEVSRSWHAGTSSWRGVADVNNFSVGIGLVNLNDGNDPYPDDQINALVELVRPMMLDYKLTAASFVGHEQIATPAGRKRDPGPAFPWKAFRARLVG